MKVNVDRTLCENHGQCTIAAPDVFRLDDDGVLQYTEEFSEDQLDEVEEAIDVCPVQAIFLESDGD
ncbi:ferredoxin [Brevibacterium luteolum]|uniref:Ferredoxin n=1 Tax=Brevibacterium luteolum TaxID=199591 RepID=A0A849ARH2_9MICO|nr:ferredoxin [Brevibacterium luteolum]MBM7529734.1 ferredoxin [Brevibacterium luteolum]NNG78495.1 ferredoxin [Brevibacterium luteolum]